MYPILDLYIMIIDIVVVTAFVIRNLMKGKHKPIDRMFVFMAASLVIWQGAIIAMYFVGDDNMNELFLCDAISNIGVNLLPLATVLVALAFSKRYQKRKIYPLLVVPLVSIVLVFTNPLHGLYYERFSIYAKDIVFGPYFYVQGIYGYICLIVSVYIIIRFALKSGSKVCKRQAILFVTSIVVPLVVNILATLGVVQFSIAATPLAFTVTVFAQAAAIYWLGFLNLAPIALQRIADSVSDAYMVLDEDKCVYSYNKKFSETFSMRYGLVLGQMLDEACPVLNDESRSFLYNLKSSTDSAYHTRSVISYEQTMLHNGRRLYYVVEVTPLINGVELGGYLALFRDVTKLRESMQREQDSLSRSMERERLASLGQMIGGIAHNLKTPIMSISGSAEMLDNLVVECSQSIGDEEVTQEDYRAICEEMTEWLVKIRSCCSYMSDIITTVKSLAANMNTTDVNDFTAEELMKRITMLLQHELKKGRCKMAFINQLPKEFKITGDINNLVQVLSNLVTNAVDAMPGGGDITVRAYLHDDQARISVTDTGSGIPPHVQGKLFKEMFTSKGAKGTGLGLYMSAALMRGKFGGGLWLAHTGADGSEFCLSIPIVDKDAKEENHAQE